MDLFAHISYGITCCSRTGLAGGSTGAGAPWYRDRSIAWAGLFGLLPDLLSMGVPFLLWLAAGTPGHFFRDINPDWLVHYRWSHSMVTAIALTGAAALLRRSLFIPALAYPVHVICDAFTHDANGKFHAPFFYPLSDRVIDGIPWWRYPEVPWAYWSFLFAVWITLAVIRRRRRSPVSERPPAVS